MNMKKINKWNVLLILTVILTLNWRCNRKKFVAKENKPLVIISATLNYRYLFLLPFTVSLWKRIGVEIIIIFVGNEKQFLENRQSMETIKMLKEMDTVIFYFQPIRLSTTSFSQIIRLFGAALPLENISDESIILTSDADLAVFKLSNHVPNLRNGKQIHLYNSECCGLIKVPPKRGNLEVKMFPMGTIGATKKIWKEIMGFKQKHVSVEAIEKYVLDEFGENFFHPTDDTNVTLIGSLIWYADQSLFSYKFSQWIKMPSNKRLASYHQAAPKRIDRILWPSSNNFSQLDLEYFDDAHLPTSIYTKNEWKQFLPFLDFAFKDEPSIINRFIKYQKSFCKFFDC